MIYKLRLPVRQRVGGDSSLILLMCMIVAASSKGNYLICMLQLCPAVLMLFQVQVKLSHRGLPNFLAITIPSQLMLVIHLNSPTYSLRASCRCSNLSCRLSRLVPPLPCKCRILLCRFNRPLTCSQ